MHKIKPLIKVCGMRDGQNILEIGKIHPDYMGFIAYPLSKRVVTEKPEQLDSLPKSIKRVGVFVDQSLENILEFAELCSLDVIQLHGEETPEFAQSVKNQGFQVWKVFGVSQEAPFDFRKLESYLDLACTDAFLFDTKTSSHGGSGQKFDWKILELYPYNKPFWISGGLISEDLKNWKTHTLYAKNLIGLDINSGFEVSPGLKDYTLLAETLEIYRNR